MRAVLKNLVDGLSEAWIRVGRYWKVAMFVSDNSSQTAIAAKSNESAISSVGTSNGNK